MGTYFDPTGLSVTDGETAKASDVNAFLTETDAAFDVAEQDIAALSGRGEAWAENDPYDPVTIGKYSAKHWATLAEDWAIGTPTDNDGVPTGDQSAKKEAEDAAAAALAASTSETNAGNSETAAAGSAQDAEDWAEAIKGTGDPGITNASAKVWAEEAEDSEVITGSGLYSAKHYAAKAATSASNAATSESNIFGIETTVEGYKDDAEAAKTGAETARDFANAWATEPTNQINDGVNALDYSAKYYANLAGTYQAQVEAEGDTQVARVAQEGSDQYDYINTLDAILKNDGDTGAAGIPAGTTVERPAIPSTGNLRFNTTSGDFEGYNGSTWVQPGTGASVTGIPVGAIVPFIGGYFGDGSNGTFTSVLGNDVATVNALLNIDGFYVCDGSALNLTASPIFNGAGRYLPNLTSDIFLMGDTAAGVTGGVNTDSHQHYGPAHTHDMGDHTHSVDPPSTGTSSTGLSSNYNGSHTHSQMGKSSGGWDFDYGSRSFSDDVNTNTGSSGSGWGHSHSVNIGAFTSGAGGLGVETTTSGTAETSGRTGNTENRPNFLTCLYIMRVL